MIDVMLKFASRAAALADPVVQLYKNKDANNQDQFAPDLILPNVRVWRASQDTPGTDADGNPTVTHNYLPGFYILVSLPRTEPSLRDHAAIQVAADRDKMNARQDGMVLRKSFSDTLMQDLRFEPVFAGMTPPWGAWK